MVDLMTIDLGQTPAHKALEQIVREMVEILNRGTLTGRTVVNWKCGTPTSVLVEKHNGPIDGWNLAGAP